MKIICALITGLLLSFTGFSQSCLPEGIIFTTQSQIDNFQVNFPGCTTIEGNVTISGSNITSLDGLSVLTLIEGVLEVKENDLLESLAGLNGLTYAGDIAISNNGSLTSITGLENITAIDWWLNISTNNVLSSLAGLDNLASVEGISISYNNVLTSLAGLENVVADSIINIYIYENPSLTTCDINSICGFLAHPNGDHYINYNSTGCNSIEEVATACGLGITESAVDSQQSAVSIFPNPASTQVTIETAITNPNFPARTTSAVQSGGQLSIFNLNGQEVINLEVAEAHADVDISHLSRGLYFARITTDKTVMVGKFVKQ